MQFKSLKIYAQGYVYSKKIHTSRARRSSLQNHLITSARLGGRSFELRTEVTYDGVRHRINTTMNLWSQAHRYVFIHGHHHRVYILREPIVSLMHHHTLHAFSKRARLFLTSEEKQNIVSRRPRNARTSYPHPLPPSPSESFGFRSHRTGGGCGHPVVGGRVREASSPGGGLLDFS